MKIKYSIAIVGYTSWCGLGFIRGVNSYKYNNNKNNNNKYSEYESYLYSNSIIHGFFGIIMYGNPILLPFSMYKELYRLEIDMRNLENEKKSRFYNDLV